MSEPEGDFVGQPRGGWRAAERQLPAITRIQSAARNILAIMLRRRWLSSNRNARTSVNI